ncbi:MAG TPA: DUF4136 domain-containing protein [Vicinamibacterales bacterium]|nr:DUF4136 domain-containing protein [Vicinamibacterales bacterium]
MRWIAIAFLSGTAMAGCASLTVSSHVERGINFAEYVTYDWGRRDSLPVGDARLDNNEFFRDYVEGAIEKRLLAKGYERATGGEPDVVIHYHATVAQKLDVRDADSSFANCFDEDCAARVSEFEQGTLVVDVVDRRTNRLIWRGWAQDTMTGVIDNQERLERQVDEGVMKMMQLLPRGGAALR